MRLHRAFLAFLYLCTIGVLAAVLTKGYSYYRLPLLERPHAAAHDVLRSSGIVGHWLGLIGSLMMLILLLYTFRKRLVWLHRAGDIRIWLDYHIWLGVTGPLLVILHSTFKFQGLVAFSYWSMIAVALSGVLGRYLYLQIPRAESGEELNETQLLTHEAELRSELHEELGDRSGGFCAIESLDFMAGSRSGLRMLVSMIWQDLRTPLLILQLYRSLKERDGKHGVLHAALLLHRYNVQQRKRFFRSTARAYLHNWHVIHRPFAAVMLIFMFVHIAIVLLFGTWRLL